MTKKNMLGIISIIIAIIVICLQIAMIATPFVFIGETASNASGYFAILDEAESGLLGSFAGLNFGLSIILAVLVILNFAKSKKE